MRRITAGNIDNGQEPALGYSVIANLRIAREIDLITRHRSLYRRKKYVRVGIENAVSNPGRFVETAQPAVDENNKLRRPGHAHRVRRKRARFCRPGNAVPLQTDRLGK